MNSVLTEQEKAAAEAMDRLDSVDLSVHSIEDRPKPQTIDITPEALKTDAGRAKVAKALDEWQSAQAQTANAAASFLDEHAEDIAECMVMYEGVGEAVEELQRLAKTMRHKQETFLRAMAGR